MWVDSSWIHCLRSLVPLQRDWQNKESYLLWGLPGNSRSWHSLVTCFELHQGEYCLFSTVAALTCKSTRHLNCILHNWLQVTVNQQTHLPPA